jgi:hypothetical protein
MEQNKPNWVKVAEELYPINEGKKKTQSEKKPEEDLEVPSSVQRIETKEKLEHRIETGALKINDDWKGYYFRGDDSLQLIIAIEYLIAKIKLDNNNQLKLHEEMYIKSLEGIIENIKTNTLNGINNPMQLFTNTKKK